MQPEKYKVAKFVAICVLVISLVAAFQAWVPKKIAELDARVTSIAHAQTNATPPLIWSSWKKVNSGTTSDFGTTVTSDIYDASNQPNLTVAVYSSTGVSAYTIAVETAPFAVSGASWAQVTTIDFTDDGSVASPKWQQVNIPGRYGKVRIRITAITAGGGTVQVYLAT